MLNLSSYALCRQLRTLFAMFVLCLTISSQKSFAQSSQTHSNESFSDEKMNEMVPFEFYAGEFTDLINELQLALKSSYSLSGNQVADSCILLMDKNQIQGPVGQYITQVFKVHHKKLTHLLHGGSLNAICPQYSKMSLEKKSTLWTLILASIAHFESSCNPKVPNKGPNGIAYGYYQLHKGKEDLYDLKDIGLCTKNSSGDPKLASKCALSMLERQFIYDNGVLFSSRSYWDVLRPRGQSQKAKLIRSAIIKSALCTKSVL